MQIYDDILLREIPGEFEMSWLTAQLLAKYQMKTGKFRQERNHKNSLVQIQ